MCRSTLNSATTLLLAVALLAACGGNPTAAGAPSAAPSAAASSVVPTSAAASASATPAAAASPTRAASPTHTLVPRPTPAAPTPTIGGNLTIFAASSLTDAFSEMKGVIEAANSGTTITFNFAASSALRTQLAQGAKADLFASADIVQMENARKAGVIQGDSTIFVRNNPVIIVPANNPRGITTPQDLAKPGVKLVLAAPEVPIGNYARQIFAKMSEDPAYGANFGQQALANVVSNEVNVRQVVSKIQLGEGDAGIVYSSDLALVRNQVQVIAIPAEVNVIAEYPIAVVKGAGNESGARAFIDYVLSPDGVSILQKWGFLPAPPKRLAAWPARLRPRVGVLAAA